jgi:hypothetical protein
VILCISFSFLRSVCSVCVYVHSFPRIKISVCPAPNKHQAKSSEVKENRKIPSCGKPAKSVRFLFF